MASTKAPEAPAADTNGKKKGRPKGVPVTPAIVDKLDYTQTLTSEEMAASAPKGTRNSAWNQRLNQLKADTISNEVPVGEDGLPHYTLLATFGALGTASARIKDFKDDTEKLPKGGAWDIKARAVYEDGKTKGQVWARFLVNK